MIRIVGLLVLFAAPAALSQTSVPVEGDRADLGRFVGEWVGSYESTETGRQGTIVFRLVAGDDSARAVVLMVPRGTEANLLPKPVPLAVHRIEITGRLLRGLLARYDDPEWELPLETSFSGALGDDGRLEGVFRATGTRIDTVPQDGRWWATKTSDRHARQTP